MAPVKVPLRILILTSSYPLPQMPYAGPFVKTWAQATADAGCEVLVLTMSEDAHVHHYRESRNLEVVAYPYTKLIGPRLHSSGGMVDSVRGNRLAKIQLISYFLASVFYLARYVREWKPHVIEANFLIPAGFIAATMKPITRRPLLVNAWGTELTLESSPLYDSVLRFVQKNADMLAIISKDMMRLAEKHGLDAARMVLVPSAVDSNRFAPLEIREQSAMIIVGIVKRLIKEKCVDDAIQAVAKLGSQDRKRMRLRIVGDGPERDRLKRMAEQLNVSQLTEFVGSIRYEKLVEEYHRMDIGINPSAFEGGTSTSMLEMMACRVPVISVRAAGNDEIITDGETGLFYDCGDLDGLARQISRLINDRNLRLRLGLSGRAHVETHFSTKAVGELYLACCRTIVARSALEKQQL